MKKLLALLALLVPALVAAQTYEPDGAIRSMSQTHVWNSGSSAWDKWEGVVLAQQSGAWTVAGSGTFTVTGTVAATQSGTWAVVPGADIAAAGSNFTGVQTKGPFAVDAGYPTAAIQLSGVWSGTIVVERSVDGTNYEITPLSTGSDVVTSITANGIYVFPIGAAQFIQFRSTAWSSGTGVWSAAKSLGVQVFRLAAPLPTGTNSIGAVTQGGTWNIGTLTSITNPVAVTGTFFQATQPVSAASLPLPTGAATEATLGTRLAEATFTARIPVNGQAAMAASVPVVVASNQSAIPVSAASLPLPAGASTAALQDGIIRDGAGDTTQANVIAGRVVTDGSQVTQPISAASLPLPTGAATEATLVTRAASTQLPAALVGSRLDVNLGAVGGTAQSGAQMVDVGNTAWRVNCVTGCVAGGSFADGAAFTFGTTPVSNTAFVVDDVASTTVAENSAGAGRMSTNRIPYFALRTAAGAALLGQGTMAASIPVVFASDQSTLSNKILDGTGAGQADVSAAAPPLTNEGLNVRAIDSERTTSGSIDGAVLNSAVTISGEGASSITVDVGSGLAGAGFLALEGTVNGSTWIGVPVDTFFGASTTTLPSHFNERNIVPFPNSGATFKFTQPGFRSYRVRVATAGAAGTATVVLSAAAAGSAQIQQALYFAGTQPFDLTIPGNSVTINAKGSSMIAITWSATLGASTVTPRTAANALACYSLGSSSVGYRTTWTGAVNGVTWVCPLYGADVVTLTKDVGVGAGSSTVTFYVSMSGSTPADDVRPVTEWVNGASPSSVLAGSPKVLRTPEGITAVTIDHPRRFSCSMSSTATTSTVITGCFGSVSTMVAPGAGLAFYITSYSWGSSIISTTTNFMTLQYGTGGTCGTGTAPFHRGFIPAAFNTLVPDIGDVPIRAGTNAEVCFLHPGAGTRFINIRGYVAP